MIENEIATIVVDKCLKIHRKWGTGLFESVYEKVLCYELRNLNLNFERQKPVNIVYENITLRKVL
jgi:GxxExxY protein